MLDLKKNLFETDIPSEILSNQPKFKLSEPFSIAEVGVQFLYDFELSWNVNDPYSNKAGPPVFGTYSYRFSNLLPAVAVE